MRRQAPVPGQYGLFDETLPLRSEEEGEALPKTARHLVEVIGLQATIDLVKAHGGGDLLIPSVVAGTSRMWEVLVEAVGVEAATQLVEYFAGTVIYVPECRSALLAIRDRDIIRRYGLGVPVEELRWIDRTSGRRLTRRQVFRIVKKPL